jgi:hypothetical protein
VAAVEANGFAKQAAADTDRNFCKRLLHARAIMP